MVRLHSRGTHCIKVEPTEHGADHCKANNAWWEIELEPRMETVTRFPNIERGETTARIVNITIIIMINAWHNMYTINMSTVFWCTLAQIHV